MADVIAPRFITINGINISYSIIGLSETIRTSRAHGDINELTGFLTLSNRLWYFMSIQMYREIVLNLRMGSSFRDILKEIEQRPATKPIQNREMRQQETRDSMEETIDLAYTLVEIIGGDINNPNHPCLQLFPFENGGQILVFDQYIYALEIECALPGNVFQDE